MEGRGEKKGLGSQENASTAPVRPIPSHGQRRAGKDLWVRARGRQGGLDPGPRGHCRGMRSGRHLGHGTWSALGTTKPGPPGLGAAPLAESVSWEHGSGRTVRLPRAVTTPFPVLFSDFPTF